MLFAYQLTLHDYEHYPVSILTGVARFGGIFAVLRGLMILMQYLNKIKFEKKCRRHLRKSEAESDLKSISFPKRKGIAVGIQDEDEGDSVADEESFIQVPNKKKKKAKR